MNESKIIIISLPFLARNQHHQHLMHTLTRICRKNGIYLLCLLACLLAVCVFFPSYIPFYKNHHIRSEYGLVLWCDEWEKNRNAIITTTTTLANDNNSNAPTHTGTSEGFEKWARSTLPTKQAHICTRIIKCAWCAFRISCEVLFSPYSVIDKNKTVWFGAEA